MASGTYYRTIGSVSIRYPAGGAVAVADGLGTYEWHETAPLTRLIEITYYLNNIYYLDTTPDVGTPLTLHELPYGFVAQTIVRFGDVFPTSPFTSIFDSPFVTINYTSDLPTESALIKWNNWSGLGIEFLNPVYDPASSSAFLTNEFFAQGYIDSGVVPGLLFLDPSASGVIHYIQGDYTSTDVPPASLDPVFNVQTVDLLTGEISWELPVEADGTTIQYLDADDNVISSYQDDAVLTFIIPGTGARTVTLISTILSPLDTGTPVEYGITIPESIPDFIMSGGIDLGGTPTLQFVGNPSGIYTLVPNQYRDILYERIPAPATNPVKIPRPFIKGPFVGD